MSGNPYEDIIGLPHHVSRNRPRMPMSKRAAQFAPFAALRGYRDVIAEAERRTEPRPELDEDRCAELNRRLALLVSRLADCPEVRIRYFVPDERKPGGAYATASGRVRQCSGSERKIVMTDGTVVPIPDVVEIDGGIFAEMDME